MSSGQVVTSTALGNLPAEHVFDSRNKCERIVEPCVLFSPEHDYSTTVPQSVVFKVISGSPKLIRAFSMDTDDSMTLRHAWGRNGGDLFEDVVLAGSTVVYSPPDNQWVLVAPGSYQLTYNAGVPDGTTGEATVVCEDISCCDAELILSDYKARISPVQFTFNCLGETP